MRSRLRMLLIMMALGPPAMGVNVALCWASGLISLEELSDTKSWLFGILFFGPAWLAVSLGWLCGPEPLRASSLIK